MKTNTLRSFRLPGILGELQQLTSDLRIKWQDESIGTVVKQGQFQLVHRVTVGRKTIFEPMGPWMTLRELMDAMRDEITEAGS